MIDLRKLSADELAKLADSHFGLLYPRDVPDDWQQQLAAERRQREDALIGRGVIRRPDAEVVR